MSAILLAVDFLLASQDHLMGHLFEALESSVGSIEDGSTLILVEVRVLPYYRPLNQSNVPHF
jgi:hypothetical protein